MTLLDPDPLTHAVNILQQGGIIGYPTEGVYGLGCDPFNPSAISALYALKKRSLNKPFILVASTTDQILELIDLHEITEAQQIFARWPSAITWVFPLSELGKAKLHTDHTSIAIRVSQHPVIQALCTRWGKPVISTSANEANHPPIKTYDQMVAEFNTLFVLPGKLGSLLGPTPIFDAKTGDVLRQGVDTHDPK